MKYPGITLGRVEAVWNKLGGEEGVDRFLRDEFVINKSIVCVYPVIIDFSLTLAAMIKAGKYNWVNDSITARNFPMKGEETAEVTIKLIHFSRVMENGDAVIHKLDRKGMRPATIEELLALGQVYPDLQRKFPIVALGSVWRSPRGYRYVPYLWGNAGGRDLYLLWFDRRWNGHSRFAAVRK
ncbi:MAG: hypothetical protein AAB482_04405 [Patescibacteria group bacterium]